MRHDEAVITVAGSPVRAYRAGAGPALVLLHGGGLGDAQLSWAPIWEPLTGHARLLAPDLPGYGGSALGHTEPTVEGYRGWLLAFLDATGLQRAVLAGLSLGGAIALRTVLDAPTRVAGLVLLAPYGVSPRLTGGRMGDFSVHAPHAAATSAALRHSDRLLRSSLLARPHAQAAWPAFQRRKALRATPRTYLAGQLDTIGCPVLLLSGEHDRLVPPGDVRAAATPIPQARFKLVAGAGHWLLRDAPQQVADQLIAFLAAAPAAPAAPRNAPDHAATNEACRPG